MDPKSTFVSPVYLPNTQFGPIRPPSTTFSLLTFGNVHRIVKMSSTC